jgi:phosphatidylinositol alpha-1,6-mannosyltransferase
VPGDHAGKLLVVTNDFPPRRGGIESFVFSLCEGLRDQVVVYTARMPGSAGVDRRAAYPVVRDRSRMLLPTPRVARAVRAVVREHGCDRVLFGASMPLGLLTGRLRATGVRRIVGLTHGHEVWWAAVPGARQLLRRVGREVDVLTYVSDYCRDRIAGALRPEDARSMVRLAPGVDSQMFTPMVDGAPIRRRWGIEANQPVVVAASRLVARKGQDVLLEAWPRVLTDHPRAVLLIVGDGPARRRLARAAAHARLASSVVMLTDVDWREMPTVYAAGDVFALPCRTRLRGLEPEALGIVFLEAAASGLPIVVGNSGGAPETVVPGETGYVVDPRSVRDVAGRICALLADPEAASAMGLRGREWVTKHHSWEAAVATLRDLLSANASD